MPLECSAGSEIQRARDWVDALLRDKERLAQMSHLDHLRWAEELPTCGEDADLPELLSEALDEGLGLEDVQVLAMRLEVHTSFPSHIVLLR